MHIYTAIIHISLSLFIYTHIFIYPYMIIQYIHISTYIHVYPYMILIIIIIYTNTYVCTMRASERERASVCVRVRESARAPARDMRVCQLACWQIVLCHLSSACPLPATWSPIPLGNQQFGGLPFSESAYVMTLRETWPIYGPTVLDKYKGPFAWRLI